MIGPRTMRFNCETYDNDLKHYGTAVDVDTWYVANDVGIDESGLSAFVMYPNPSNGMVEFNLSGPQFNKMSLEVSLIGISSADLNTSVKRLLVDNFNLLVPVGLNLKSHSILHPFHPEPPFNR